MKRSISCRLQGRFGIPLGSVAAASGVEQPLRRLSLVRAGVERLVQMARQ